MKPTRLEGLATMTFLFELASAGQWLAALERFAALEGFLLASDSGNGGRE